MAKLYQNIFLWGLALSYALVAAIIIGLGGIAAGEYLSVLNYFMKIYICLLIIYRFNPLSTTAFTDFDRRLVFSSAVFLLSTTTIEEAVSYFSHANTFIGPLPM